MRFLLLASVDWFRDSLSLFLETIEAWGKEINFAGESWEGLALLRRGCHLVYPNKKYSNNQKKKKKNSKRAWDDGKREKASLPLFPFPIVPVALCFFSSQPSFDTKWPLRRRERERGGGGLKSICSSSELS